MTQLSIYHQDTPASAHVVLSDADAIGTALAAINVGYARWATPAVLSNVADSAAVLQAYQPQVAALKSRGGYTTVDVVRVKPDHPDRVALRQKFLSEHTHSEDEVRFFVEGHGVFYLHAGQQVYKVACEQGDLLNIPANTPHWFDSGELPDFTAIRLFIDPAGWVGHFTGNAIASRFLPDVQ